MKPTEAPTRTAIAEALESPKYVRLAAIALFTVSVLLLANRFSFPASVSIHPQLSLHSPHPPPSPPLSHPPPTPSSSPPLSHSPHPPPSPPLLRITGIIDETGAIADDFWIGDFDPEELNSTACDQTKPEQPPFKVAKFHLCDETKTDYIPCLDNDEATRGERHCPKEEKSSPCLVPPPKGYKSPIPWPQSRDEASHCNFLKFHQFVAIKLETLIY